MTKIQTPDILETFEHKIKDIDQYQKKKNKNIFTRYPITFSMVTILGLAAVLHGAENIFDSIAFFKNNPVFTLLFGMLILIGTGSIYRILQNKL